MQIGTYCILYNRDAAVSIPKVLEKLMKIEVYCGLQCLLKCSLDFHFFWI